MPVIFSEEMRENLRIQIIENAFSLIKMYGYKKTTIEDITKMSGIAKGTFYNFFKSKEDLMYELVLYKRNCSRDKFAALIQSGTPDKKKLKSFFASILNGDENVFMFLNAEDISVLKSRWPKEYWIKNQQDGDIVHWILNALPQKSGECNPAVFKNVIRIFTIGLSHQDQLNASALNETIEALSEFIILYLYGRSD